MPISPRQEALLKRTFIDFQATSEFLKRPVIFSRAEGLYLWDIGWQGLLRCDWRCLCRYAMTFAQPLHGISDVTLDFVEKAGSVAPRSGHEVRPAVLGANRPSRQVQVHQPVSQRVGDLDRLR